MILLYPYHLIYFLCQRPVKYQICERLPGFQFLSSDLCVNVFVYIDQDDLVLYLLSLCKSFIILEDQIMVILLIILHFHLLFLVSGVIKRLTSMIAQYLSMKYYYHYSLQVISFSYDWKEITLSQFLHQQNRLKMYPYDSKHQLVE